MLDHKYHNILCLLLLVTFSASHNAVSQSIQNPNVKLTEIGKLGYSNFITAYELLQYDIKHNNIKIFATVTDDIPTKEIKFNNNKTLSIIFNRELLQIKVPGKMYYHYNLLLLEYASYEYLYGNQQYAFFILKSLSRLCPELPVDTGNKILKISKLMKLMNKNTKIVNKILKFRAEQWKFHCKNIK